MKEVLTDIEDGTFARVGSLKTKTVVQIIINSKKMAQTTKLKKLVAKLRAMMPFINEGKEKVR